jgi:hypothetical protein
MADVCAACTVNVMRHIEFENDLLGWLGGQTGYGWALCEGCGLHLFNDRGERWRRCRQEQGPAVGACLSCEEAARGGAAVVVEPRARPRCWNCGAKLGLALVWDCAQVGPSRAPSVQVPDGREVCLLCYYPF